MNSYDASRMTDLLRESHGYQPVSQPEQADLILLNTCHIREKAEEKLFSELGRLRKMAGKDQRVVFGVGGCVSQAAGVDIFRRAPFVQLVFGPQNYHRLPDMLDELDRKGGRQLETDFPEESKFDRLPTVRGSGPIASVTVQEGCDRFCAFCVVPYTRGREWSRPVEAILAEVTARVNAGAVEIQLLGQNVNAYAGQDREGIGHDLALLIRAVALVPGVARIRFITSHPADMSPDLVAAFAEVPQLCPYLHLPIQSGSDAILTRMSRGHTVSEYLDWVDRLRQACPDIALASDFIVGFPGETKTNFQDTLDLVNQVAFDQAYSFQFSPRPGTPAADMGPPVATAERAIRLATLQLLLQKKQLQRNRARVGNRELVLVEGPSKVGNGEFTGRTPGFSRVNFAGSPEWVGRIIPVEITEGLPNSLRGLRVADY